MREMRFHPEANIEMLESAHFYNIECPGLGQQFIDSVEDCLIVILSNPLIGRKEANDTQSQKLVRFPFRTFYLVTNKIIWIVAVTHLCREPNYWTERLSKL